MLDATDMLPTEHWKYNAIWNFQEKLSIHYIAKKKYSGKQSIDPLQDHLNSYIHKGSKIAEQYTAEKKWSNNGVLLLTNSPSLSRITISVAPDLPKQPASPTACLWKQTNLSGTSLPISATSMKLCSNSSISSSIISVTFAGIFQTPHSHLDLLVFQIRWDHQ